LASCLESLTVDDLYPSVTTNGVIISDITHDADGDASEKKSSASSNSDLEQVIKEVLRLIFYNQRQFP
jgi:hypothetical protein